MTGEYSVEIWNKKVKYCLTIKRNITIITGDSGTGKTTLVNLVNDFDNNGKSSGVHLLCDRRCTCLHGKDWKHNLEAIKDSIVFIDENDVCLNDDAFSSEIKNTNNYYVIITRRNLSRLPYSVSEIYGLRTSGKRLETGQILNELVTLHDNVTDKCRAF